MKRFDPDVHSRRSVRLKNYNYAGDVIYYVTICVHGKRCIFGEVADERVRLSPIGEIVSECWNEIPSHHADVRLDEFVVMPNHVHGIIVIAEATHSVPIPTDIPVGATHASPNSAKPEPRPHSLDAIIGSFKSAVTKKVNESRNTSGAALWQRNYYEHVIRNERELNLIRQYIISNPLQWTLDRENPAFGGKLDGDEISAILNDDSRRGTACRAPTIANDKKKGTLFNSLIHKVSQAARDQDNPEAALQAVCQVLKDNVDHYDWVGFYLTDPNAEKELILGPYSGAPTEHVRIGFGQGICGHAAKIRKTFIVPDVSAETNYLSCSPTVRSEIVLPILKEGEVMGELDIDSRTIDAFSEEDRAFLLKVCCAVARLLYRAQQARKNSK